MSLRLLVGAAVFSLSFLFSHTVAQHTNATCLAIYGWMFNDEGQSPCLVAAYAANVCHSNNFFVVALSAGKGDGYYPPFSQDNCECSSVYYSLISACAVCQNAPYIGWTTWTFECIFSSLGTFPYNIPNGTGFPAWAYLDVTVRDQFDPAQADVNAPESTRISVSTFGVSPSTSSSISSSTFPSIPPITPPSTPSTSTSSSTSSSASVTAPNSTIGSPSTDKTSKKFDVGAIAGGVVGGFFLLLLAGLAAFLLRRRRSGSAPSAQGDSLHNSEASPSALDVPPRTSWAPMQEHSQLVYHPYDPMEQYGGATPQHIG